MSGAGPASPAVTLDVERVVCRLSDLGPQGARGFVTGGGDWPLRGFVVRAGERVFAYVNRCPHAGHPLNLLPDRFLTPDGALIMCAAHGAVFEKAGGTCLAGPCPGKSLTRVPIEIRCGFVIIADEVDVAALAAETLQGP